MDFPPRLRPDARPRREAEVRRPGGSPGAVCLLPAASCSRYAPYLSGKGQGPAQPGGPCWTVRRTAPTKACRARDEFCRLVAATLRRVNRRLAPRPAMEHALSGVPASLVFVSHKTVPAPGERPRGRGIAAPAPSLRHSIGTSPARAASRWADSRPHSRACAQDCAFSIRAAAYPVSGRLPARTCPRGADDPPLQAAACLADRLPAAADPSLHARRPYSSPASRCAPVQRSPADPPRADRTPASGGLPRLRIRVRSPAAPAVRRPPHPRHAFRIPLGRVDRCLQLFVSRCPIHRARSPAWSPPRTGPPPRKGRVRAGWSKRPSGSGLPRPGMVDADGPLP